jgi:hypothetical protein
MMEPPKILENGHEEDSNGLMTPASSRQSKMFVSCHPTSQAGEEKPQLVLESNQAQESRDGYDYFNE